MEVTRYDEAPSYEAPGHFDVYGLRLQGFEVSKTRNFWMSISHFLPKGGCTYDATPLEKVYFVLDGEVIAAAGNERELRRSPVAHAEMLAIEQAAAHMDSWRLLNTVLYVTLEPCPMCAGAVVQARIPRLVYGAPDEKAGAAGTLYNVCQDDRLNHCLDITSGVLADESAALLRQFFQARR